MPHSGLKATASLMMFKFQSNLLTTVSLMMHLPIMLSQSQCFWIGRKMYIIFCEYLLGSFD